MFVKFAFFPEAKSRELDRWGNLPSPCVMPSSSCSRLGAVVIGAVRCGFTLFSRETMCHANPNMMED